jgi:hypothetical protein
MTILVDLRRPREPIKQTDRVPSGRWWKLKRVT